MVCCERTFRSLGQGHAQPAHGHAALAAHAGGPGAEGVKGDGADDQGQVEGQVDGPGDVHVDLSTDTEEERKTLLG